MYYYFLLNLERTLGIDEDLLAKLESEVADHQEQLESLLDSTEERKLEVKIMYFLLINNCKM